MKSRPKLSLLIRATREFISLCGVLTLVYVVLCGVIVAPYLDRHMSWYIYANDFDYASVQDETVRYVLTEKKVKHVFTIDGDRAFISCYLLEGGTLSPMTAEWTDLDLINGKQILLFYEEYAKSGQKGCGNMYVLMSTEDFHKFPISPRA